MRVPHVIDIMALSPTLADWLKQRGHDAVHAVANRLATPAIEFTVATP